MMKSGSYPQEVDSTIALKTDEFYSKVVKRYVDINSDYPSLLKEKYQCFRGYSWQLGGFLLGLVEQTILLTQSETIYRQIDHYYQKVCLTKYKTTNATTIQGYFYKIIKEIFNSPYNSRLSKLIDRLKDENFIQGCEQFVKDILKYSNKFPEYNLDRQIQIEDSVRLMSPQIINYLGNLFDAEIVMMSYDKSFKDIGYSTYKISNKILFAVFYTFPSGLYAAYYTAKQSQTVQMNIGDKFQSLKDLKDKNKNNQSNLINKNVTSQIIKRQPEQNNQQNLDDLKLCNKCNAAVNINLLFKNDGCPHYFCKSCLLQGKRGSGTMFCLQSACTWKISIEKINQFLLNYKKLEEQIKGIEAQMSRSQQIPANKNNENDFNPLRSQQIPSSQQSQQNKGIQKCCSCYKMYQPGQYYQDLSCQHIYCYNCIFEKFQRASSLNKNSSCNICNTILNAKQIYQFIMDQQKLNQKQEQKPQQQIKICSECQRQNHIMYYPIRCKHGVCQNCLARYMQKKLSPADVIWCRTPQCTSTFTLKDICNFNIESQNLNKQDNQSQNSINNSISGKDSNNNNNKNNGNISVNNNNNNSINSSNNTSINNSINQNKQDANMSKSTSISGSDTTSSQYINIPRCSQCRKKYEESELFQMKKCRHLYCDTCIEKFVNIYDRCQVSGCNALFDVEEIDNYLCNKLISSQKLSDQNQKFDVLCSTCNKTDSIMSNSKPDYFKCKSCSQLTCLIHNSAASQCKCFCEKCSNECKKVDTTIMCVKCNYSYCSICQQTTAGNQKCQCVCQFCGSQLNRSKLCKCLENTCSYCLNQFDNIHLNSLNDTLIRKNPDCIHSYCNGCYYEKVINESKQNQAKSSKLLQVCLFC